MYSGRLLFSNPFLKISKSLIFSFTMIVLDNFFGLNVAEFCSEQVHVLGLAFFIKKYIVDNFPSE